MNASSGLLSMLMQQRQVGATPNVTPLPVPATPLARLLNVTSGTTITVVSVLTAIAVAVISFLVGALILRWLWNAVATRLFRVPAITFWQAAGLKLLAGSLFGGWNLL